MSGPTIADDLVFFLPVGIQVEQEVERVVVRVRFVCKARGYQLSRELGGAFPG
jgi:hypothetical protein